MTGSRNFLAPTMTKAEVCRSSVGYKGILTNELSYLLIFPRSVSAIKVMGSQIKGAACSNFHIFGKMHFRRSRKYIEQTFLWTLHVNR